MKKEKYNWYLKRVAEYFIVGLLACYINDEILVTGKWYIEFGVYLILFILLDVVKVVVKKIKGKTDRK